MPFELTVVALLALVARHRLWLWSRRYHWQLLGYVKGVDQIVLQREQPQVGLLLEYGYGSKTSTIVVDAVGQLLPLLGQTLDATNPVRLGRDNCAADQSAARAAHQRVGRGSGDNSTNSCARGGGGRCRRPTAVGGRRRGGGLGALPGDGAALQPMLRRSVAAPEMLLLLLLLSDKQLRRRLDGDWDALLYNMVAESAVGAANGTPAQTLIKTRNKRFDFQQRCLR